MTPTQLRAFTTVVRHGSVKAAALELDVTESAVSMNIKNLRAELDDRLFVRSGGTIAFTPGGLRLASRAHEMLGLQDQTRREVRQAAGGKRLLRLAGSSLFNEYAAAGLIELFSAKAKDLEVELSDLPTRQLLGALEARQVDLAIGPALPPRSLDARTVEQRPFLRYELVAVTSRALASDGRRLGSADWLLGPAAAEDDGVTPQLLAALGVPESRQRIFQSHAAALEQVRAGHGIGLAIGFRVASELASGKLVRLDAKYASGHGTWHLYLPAGQQLSSAAEELSRFITRPRTTQAMINGSGAGIARFQPRVHVTLWS